jgi:hypothetical protein
MIFNLYKLKHKNILYETDRIKAILLGQLSNITLRQSRKASVQYFASRKMHFELLKGFIGYD